MALMLVLYVINGAAFLMMTPAALVFSNILMGVLILIYGLLLEFPVAGLPIFYLLTLFCQSNAPASPVAIGNNVSDVMYICQMFFAMAGGQKVMWADIIALVVNLMARAFLMSSIHSHGYGMNIATRALGCRPMTMNGI
jgi:hypothetical protein